MFKKIDDRTVILWIINNEHFTGEGQKLSYCGEQVQRAYARLHRADKPTKASGSANECFGDDCPVRWEPPSSWQVVK